MTTGVPVVGAPVCVTGTTEVLVGVGDSGVEGVPVGVTVTTGGVVATGVVGGGVGLMMGSKNCRKTNKHSRMIRIASSSISRTRKTGDVFLKRSPNVLIDRTSRCRGRTSPHYASIAWT